MDDVYRYRSSEPYVTQNKHSKLVSTRDSCIVLFCLVLYVREKQLFYCF